MGELTIPEIRIFVQSAVETKTILDVSDANAYLHTAVAYVAANPQDASRRGNPSDRSLTGARNPQDMKAFDNGTPQIIMPEKR